MWDFKSLYDAILRGQSKIKKVSILHYNIDYICCLANEGKGLQS